MGEKLFLKLIKRIELIEDNQFLGVRVMLILWSVYKGIQISSLFPDFSITNLESTSVNCLGLHAFLE